METKRYLETLRRAKAYISARFRRARPSTAVILGSGLARAVPELENRRVIPYASIPGFPRTTVKGHEGKLILGRIARREVAVLQGRFHYYEGHSMAEVTLPVRVLASLGLKNLIVTAAVGSMRPRIKPGHVVVVKDHVNFMGRNPLRGLHQEEFGTMFPDLMNAYDPEWRKTALRACRRRKIACREGVYVASPGPSYETPAEIQAFRRLGGDVVGMSVVPEAIAARQMGVRVLALAWVANMAAGLTRAALTHAEVLDLGQRMSLRLKEVLEGILAA